MPFYFRRFYVTTYSFDLREINYWLH
jgi:hypothetical protein